ncbi:MAG: Amuc_1099 family pilus-like system protein, partial [Chthoniobacterales bacterium]
ILESGNDLFPGISNAWVIEHDLDYLDPGLPEADPDADGFTNFEEFTAKTNPRDAASKPAEWTKLRVNDVKIEQMQLIFTGRDVKGRANINSVAASLDALTGRPIGPTKTYVPGDTLIVAKFRPGFAVTYEEEKTPFQLANFRTENRENPRISMADGKPKIEEIVFAVLKSASGDNATVDLEAGKPQTTPYSLATLQDTKPGGATVQIRIGETFDLGGPARYKLVDVSEENAIIQDLGSGEKHVIPKAAAPAPEPTPEDAQPQ